MTTALLSSIADRAPPIAEPIVFEAPERALRSSPTWTDDPFEADAWRANDPNPAAGGNGVVSFGSIPASFRLACKEFLSAANQGAAGGRRIRSIGTAVLVAGFLRHLACRLEAKGVSSFARATSSDVEEAQIHLLGLNTDHPATAAHAKRCLATLSALHRLGPSGFGVIIDGLAFDPSQQPINIGRSRNLRPTGSTPVLSEDTARRLLAMAVDWVENKAEAAQWVIAAHQAFPNSGGGRLARTMRFLRENPGFLEGLMTARAAFGGPLIDLVPSRTAAGKGEREMTDIELDCLWLGPIARATQLAFQGFCYVVCAGFNGWRASEVMSIEPDSLRETPSGHLLTTKIRKTGANPRQKIERPVPPIVALAVSKLAEVNAHAAWPRESDAARPEEGSIFRTSAGGLTTSGSINDCLSASWAHFTGDEQRITTHQFRRFFAYFFLRRHQGNLDAVRRHFRHVSRDMIWAYAKDALNAEYLAAEKQSLAQEIASSVVFGDGHASTSVAGDLKEVRASLRLGAKILTVEDAAAYIDRRIKKLYVDVQAMEWGYCLIQACDKGGACEGQHGPIEDRTEPSVCGRCKFLCTGQENVAFWRHSAGLHEEIVAHAKSTQPMKAASERLVATARRIIALHKEAGIKEDGDE